MQQLATTPALSLFRNVARVPLSSKAIRGELENGDALGVAVLSSGRALSAAPVS